MLKSLFIQNYALIDTLDIRFEPGFPSLPEKPVPESPLSSVQSACCSVSAQTVNP